MNDLPEPEPTKWCPLCEPDVDPTEAYVIELHCFRHRQDLEGEDDRLMAKRLGEEPDKTMTDAQTQRAWGVFLRRSR